MITEDSKARFLLALSRAVVRKCDYMQSSHQKFVEGMRRLRRYESKSLVAAEYMKLHNVAVDDVKARSITMCIQQGRELFESLQKSDYMTKPIELYYGMSAFARAMIMLANPQLSEKDLEHRHGMRVSPLPQTVNTVQEILRVPINFQDGEFTQWYEEAQKTFVLRVNRSECDWTYGYNTQLAGKQTTFGELLTLFPDAWTELEIVTGAAPVRLAVSNARKGKIELNGKASNAQVEACFPDIGQDKATHLNNVNWNVDYADLTDFVPQLAQDYESGFQIGETRVVPPLGDLRLSPLAACISTAYAMSMFARYRPSIWGAVWNGVVADEMVPLFERVMYILQTWAPLAFAQNIADWSDTPEA